MRLFTFSFHLSLYKAQKLNPFHLFILTLDISAHKDFCIIGLKLVYGVSPWDSHQTHETHVCKISFLTEIVSPPVLVHSCHLVSMQGILETQTPGNLIEVRLKTLYKIPNILLVMHEISRDTRRHSVHISSYSSSSYQLNYETVNPN